ncbi:MAG: TRAP transporter small permease [Rhizobiaceae bacterium]|nr:TRAP transporter small permease [Rhizobiaceae bacterium]
MGKSVRKILDGMYLAGGVAAALCLIAIVCLIVLQIASRNFGFAFRGGPDYAGYAMAAASFLGFAYALNHGAHIRVSLLVSALGRYRFWGELWCYGVGTAITSIFAWYACNFTYESYRFKDISSGLDATPLWIPQLSMAIGSILLAICFWDNLITLIMKREPNVLEGSVDEPGEEA